MLIYTLNPLLIILYAIILQPSKSTLGKKCFLFIAFIQLLLISALRADTVGADLPNYHLIFDYVTFNQLKSFEFGYTLINLLVKIFTANFQIFILFVSFLVIFPIFLEISRRSINVFISVLTYILLFYYYQSFNQIRQMLAFSFVFFSLRYIEKQEFLKFSIWILIAGSIHFSSLIFFPLYFFYKYEFKLKMLLKYFIATGVLWFLFDVIKKYVFLSISRYKGYFQGEYYYNISKMSIFNLILRVIIICFCFLYYQEVVKNNWKNHLLFHIMGCLIVFQIFMLNNSILARLPTYFWGFLILLLPEILEVISKKQRRFLITGIATFSLFVYFFLYLNMGSGKASGIVPYSIFAF